MVGHGAATCTGTSDLSGAWSYWGGWLSVSEISMAHAWNCPACHNSIRRDQDAEQDPSMGKIYRCHRCRLELVFDPMVRMLTVKPQEDTRERV
jgi:hypothetical protein